MIFPRYNFTEHDTLITQIYKIKEECSEALLEGMDDSHSDRFLEECVDIVAAAEGLQRLIVEKCGMTAFKKATAKVYTKNVERGYWKEYGIND